MKYFVYLLLIIQLSVFGTYEYTVEYLDNSEKLGDFGKFCSGLDINLKQDKAPDDLLYLVSSADDDLNLIKLRSFCRGKDVPIALGVIIRRIGRFIDRMCDTEKIEEEIYITHKLLTENSDFFNRLRTEFAKYGELASKHPANIWKFGPIKELVKNLDKSSLSTDERKVVNAIKWRLNLADCGVALFAGSGLLASVISGRVIRNYSVRVISSILLPKIFAGFSGIFSLAVVGIAIYKFRNWLHSDCKLKLNNLQDRYKYEISNYKDGVNRDLEQLRQYVSRVHDDVKALESDTKLKMLQLAKDMVKETDEKVSVFEQNVLTTMEKFGDDVEGFRKEIYPVLESLKEQNALVLAVNTKAQKVLEDIIGKKKKLFAY